MSKKNNLIKVKTSSAIKKIVGKKLFNMFPEISSTILALVNITENFDSKSPQTELYKFNKKMEALDHMPERKKKKLARLLFWAFKKMLKNEPEPPLVDDLCKHAKEQAKKDSRYSLLIKLMNKADEKIPNSSILAIMGYLKPHETLAVNATLAESLEAAEKAHGEHRAKLIRHALLEVSEYAYYPYLLAIFRLSYLAEGEMPPLEILPFGELVKQAANRLKDYPGLVEERAGWLRNCAAHHLPNYLPDEDAVIVGAKGVPPVKMKVDELVEITKSIHLISTHTILQVSNLYMLRNFIQGDFLKLIWQNLRDSLSNDPEKIALVEKNFETHFQAKFQKLIDFADQNTQASS